MLLYHKTTIGRARDILTNGFEDEKWRFEERDARIEKQLKVLGVWLTDRPLEDEEGPQGDAVIEVDLALDQEMLAAYELEGMLEGARLWVAPAQLVNAHANARILHVDPRTSWWDGVKPPGVDSL
ncbi:MAG: hypothetical protein ACE5PT_14245 [Gemmatimonadales bacterium]